MSVKINSILIFFMIIFHSISFADNPSFRRHVYWYKDGYCKVREWFVDYKGDIMYGEGDPDKALYEPKIKINQNPYCREISKPDKYLSTI